MEAFKTRPNHPPRLHATLNQQTHPEALKPTLKPKLTPTSPANILKGQQQGWTMMLLHCVYPSSNLYNTTTLIWSSPPAPPVKCWLVPTLPPVGRYLCRVFTQTPPCSALVYIASLSLSSGLPSNRGSGPGASSKAARLDPSSHFAMAPVGRCLEAVSGPFQRGRGGSQASTRQRFLFFPPNC